MKNFLINTIFSFLKILDEIIKKVFKKKNFLQLLHDKIEENQYTHKIINNKKINFFCPSSKTMERVNTLFTKEPETLMWIDKFDYNQKNLVFWDIGANIGLYSLYASAKFSNIEVVAFEPGTSNLRVLSRNIFINSFSDKIKICQLALNDKVNTYKSFKEVNFGEGRGRANFNNRIDQHGNRILEENIKNKYTLLGTSIDYLLENKILRTPNYMKIDVDGIEREILNGAKKLFLKKELKEVQIELNPSFKESYEEIHNFFIENGFKKIVETNQYLIKNKNFKLNYKNILNTVFQRVD